MTWREILENDLKKTEFRELYAESKARIDAEIELGRNSYMTPTLRAPERKKELAVG